MKIFFLILSGLLISPFSYARSGRHTSNCAASAGLSPAGTATTSIYYTPIMSTEQVRCGRQSLNVIVDHRGRKIRDCAAIRSILNMQGAGIVRASGVALENFVYSGGHFNRTSADRCPMGQGSSSELCLNPFRTIAAHMGNGYKKGDVLFFPKTVGMRYPQYNGQPRAEWATHDGHWVVGDTGSKIKGQGRFDFFAGDMDWRNPENPLAQLGLGRSQIEHCRVNASVSARIREQIGYPGLTPQIRYAWANSRPPERFQAAQAAPAAHPRTEHDWTHLTGPIGL